MYTISAFQLMQSKKIMTNALDSMINQALFWNEETLK
jgi:hypothetical protein